MIDHLAPCDCTHDRHRHTGCSTHQECCDEDACECVAFTPAQVSSATTKGGT